jgi:predicted phosphate transport protein (TIGR00153 family)
MIFKKEKEVIELILKYLDEAAKCMAMCKNATKHYIDNDIKNAKLLARQTRALESAADVIRYEIRDKLYSGAYLPVLREDIYKLVESIDKVANAAEAFCDFFLNQRPQIPEELKAQFWDAISRSLGTFEPLQEAVQCFLKGTCPTQVARDYAKEVGLQESVVDKVEWDLTKAIFISNQDYSHKLHLKLCLDAITEVSDRAEDAADHLALTILKSSF